MTHVISFYSGNIPHKLSKKLGTMMPCMTHAILFWKCHINCRKKIGTFIHTDTFTHRSFYTETLSHTETFTHRSFHTQTLLHTDIFNHRHFYTHTHVFLLHTATLSHTEAFIRKILSLQTVEISRYLCCLFFHFFCISLYFFAICVILLSFWERENCKKKLLPRVPDLLLPRGTKYKE